jgi:hypothetical protein
MTKKRSKAAILVFAAETDFSSIVEWPGVEPSRVVAGDAKSGRESKFILDSRLSDELELRDHVASLLTILESREDKFPMVKDKISNMTLFCMFSSSSGQGTADLPAGLLRRLARHEVDLVIDLYPPA